MQSRAADLDRSRAWWERRRARGICAVCTLPLAADKVWPVHLECARLVRKGHTYAEVRAMSPTEREQESRQGV